MKYIFFLSILCVLFFLSSGCSVNSNTGLIIITNYCDVAITDIKIGSIILNNYLSPNSKSEYWFYQDLSGEISSSANVIAVCDGYNDETGQNNYNTKNSNCYYKRNYKYTIDIYSIPESQQYITAQLITYMYIYPGYKVGADSSDKDYIHYPGE